MRHLLPVLVFACAAWATQTAPPSVPLFFIANHGQGPSTVRFMAQGSGITAYFSPEEALLRMGESSVRMQWVGVSPFVQLEGMVPLSGRANFLTGAGETWRSGVPLYGAVAYRQLYPGIDMFYGGNGRNLKSEFVVAPGADPAQIQVRYQGAGALRIEDGFLVIPVDGHELREQPPELYQERAGKRHAVTGRFVLAEDGIVSFQVGEFDPSLPLIIDPVLSYSTFLGGSSSDAGTSLAVDASGAAYVTGFTASYDFPTANPAQNFSAGSNDVFVAKLNATGDGLIYCTYLGGRGDDRAYGIAVDANGSAYVTGSTTSTNFPLSNALQTKLTGSRNAFVFKLNPAGNALVFSTYLGGNVSDTGNGIAVDSSQNAYVVGDTTSLTFPATGMQKNLRGGQDAFVVKLSPTGTLVYSTYLGGVNDDHGAAIAVDASGSAYVAGSTYSGNFPVANAWQGAIAGGQDAFVARLNAAGSALLFSTFLGGSGGSVGYPESAQGIALDAQGNAYIAGVTSSSNFPLLHPLQITKRGSSTDAFAAKLTSAGVLSYSTYLGGSGVDSANAVAVDAAGCAYVAGQTFSSDLPILNSYQPAKGGDYDAFWAKLSPTGDSLLALSYLGGMGSDTATSVALDSVGRIYLAGWTLSTNFPVVNGYQSINAGTYGAFVARLSLGAAPAAVAVTPNSGTGAAQTFSLQFSDSAGATNITSVSALFNSTTGSATACSVTYTVATNALVLLTDTGAAPAGSITPGSGSQQNTQCVLNGAASSVSLSGTTLTLNLALTFSAAFSGSQNIYLQATNPNASTGWQLRGSWTVAAGPPAPVSVTPSSGSGSSQNFAFLFTDPKGFAAISLVSIIINSSPAGAGGCYVLYYRGPNVLYLGNDAGAGWLTPVTIGQAGTVQNSQCSINAAASSVSGSGNNLTLNLAMTFQPSFGGNRNIYMEVYDGADSGWAQEGTWTVPSVALGPVSVTPSSGTGSSQTFALLFADPKGYAAISMVSILINSSISGASSCYVLYYRAPNVLYLANDTNTGWLAPVTIGQSGTVQNSQCSINAAASSVSGSGNNLTLNLATTFQPSFGGSRNIYMEVYDGADSGWAQKGTWTVPSAVLAPVSVTPSSGTGSSQNFAFLFSDPSGYAAISMVSILANSSLSGASGCYLLYYRGPNVLYLANDAGTAWSAPVTIGQSGTVQNSQCSINAAASSVSGSGNNLTLNLAMSFKPAFSGTRNLYMEVYDGADSGWAQKGTWIVP